MESTAKRVEVNTEVSLAALFCGFRHDEAGIFAREVAHFFTAQFAPVVAMDGIAHLFTRILYIRLVEDCVGKALCSLERPSSLRA